MGMPDVAVRADAARAETAPMLGAPSLPLTQAADEDSDLDDPDDLPDEAGEPLLNMTWWDDVTWAELVGHQAATMIEVPRALRSAVAQWRGRICRHIETRPSTEPDEQ